MTISKFEFLFSNVINKTDYFSIDMATSELLNVTEQAIEEGTGN